MKGYAFFTRCSENMRTQSGEGNNGKKQHETIRVFSRVIRCYGPPAGKITEDRCSLNSASANHKELHPMKQTSRNTLPPNIAATAANQNPNHFRNKF